MILKRKGSQCFHCGHLNRMSGDAFCQRCGLPGETTSYDPFCMRTPATSELVDEGAKLVIRIGVAGTGLIVLFSGVLLLMTGEADAMRLWMSRILGPMMLVYGGLQTLSPFRKAKAAKVIRLDDFRKRSPKAL